MKNLLYSFLILLAIQLSSLCAQAQSEGVEMADTLRQEGKIYVVVIVVVIIFTGLLTYVFILDKKIGKLEKEINNQNTK